MGRVIDYRVKKLYHKKVSIRDYVVDSAVINGHTIKVIYKDNYMLLDTDRLITPISKSKVIESKFNGNYRLYDFLWTPERKQLSLDKMGND